MATAFRNKFEARCSATGVRVPAFQGWVVPEAGGGWRPISDEVARKEGHRLVEGQPKKGGRGKKWNLDVTDTWAFVFKTNEENKKKWTDAEISKIMQDEFPEGSPDSKSVARVRMFRSNYNRGAHSFAGRGVPAVHSREYDENGQPVAQKVRAPFGGGVGEARVREIVGESAALLRKELKAAAEKPTVLVSFAPKKVKKVDAAGKHRKFVEVLKKVEAGLPVLLVGPSGSGKTFLAAQVAEALDLDFTFNSMSEGVSESSLLGRVLPDKNGAWTYRPAPFVQSFRDGGVHLLDEIDASDPNLLVVINAAVANGLLSLPFADVKPIRRHDRSIILAAANTYGSGASREYVGRNQLDAATLNRFTMGTVEIDYDRDVEAAIVGGIVEKGGDLLLKWAWQVRDAIAANRLRRIMSTRNVEDGAKLLAVGLDLAAVKATYFQGWSPDEARKCSGLS